MSWNQQTTFTHMMADHGELCKPEDATYCMNGGTCYKISSMDTLSCVCDEYYKGSRCEHFALQSSSADPKEIGLIAAVVVVVILILVVLAAVIYHVYRMKARMNQDSRSKPQEYWKVESNVSR